MKTAKKNKSYFVVIEVYTVNGMVLQHPVFEIVGRHDEKWIAERLARDTHKQCGLHTLVIEAPVIFDSRKG